jgi:hypothetical protein
VKLFKRKPKPQKYPYADKAWCFRCKDASYSFRFDIEVLKSGRRIAIGQCIKCGTPTKRII